MKYEASPHIVQPFDMVAVTHKHIPQRLEARGYIARGGGVLSRHLWLSTKPDDKEGTANDGAHDKQVSDEKMESGASFAMYYMLLFRTSLVEMVEDTT